MMRALVDQHGAVLRLGAELGRGGEGAVFALPERPQLVAKLYHQHIDSAKQDKLRLMAAGVDAALLAYTTWPQATLHERLGGPVVGFLMGRLEGRAAIHKLYGPAHRKQDFPKVAWDFLLTVARNIAAAFETLHAHGHVIGDVNQGNVVVGADSRVALIDCDSFQVAANGRLFRCEVGVPHFTPPELQTVRRFDQATRTPNHDNFGLALLVFHLLFGGRHPFSGVPRARGDLPLEAAIAGFKFAYSRTAPARGIDPPPNTLSLSLLPDTAALMFERAFTEGGAAPTGRPTAADWVGALDALRGQLARCPTSRMHVYPNRVNGCPWCGLESRGIVMFIDVGTVFAPTATGFDLTEVWAAIEATRLPPLPTTPSPQQFSVTPQPLPAGVSTGRGAATARRVGIVLLAIVLSVVVPQGFIWFALIAAVLYGAVGATDNVVLRDERVRRRQAVQTARQQFEAAAAQWEKLGRDPLHREREALHPPRDSYRDLPKFEQEALQRLERTARDRQLTKYLEKYFVEDAVINGVGASRKATLASFGIETAADVSYSAVSAIQGFGPKLTQAVVEWRKGLESRFAFIPGQAVTAAERAAVKAQVAQRRQALEAELTRGLATLQRKRAEVLAQRAALQAALSPLAQVLAQAEADVAVLP